MNVIIDTNMLMAIVQFKIDVLSELKRLGARNIYIIDGTLEELKNINESKIIINTLNNLINEKEIKIIHSNGPVDNEILRISKENKFAIATNDKEIIKKAKQMKIRIIRIRQKKFLVIE